MNKMILVVSIATILATPPVFSNDSGIFPEDAENYCYEKFDPINCGREYFEGLSDIYLQPETAKDCKKYAKDAILKMFDENPKFASGVHYSNRRGVIHEITFIDRDYASDTKSSFGCALGLETKYKNELRPYTNIRYSVSQTYVDGTVIYINDFEYVGVY